MKEKNGGGRMNIETNGLESVELGMKQVIPGFSANKSRLNGPSR